MHTSILGVMAFGQRYNPPPPRPLGFLGSDPGILSIWIIKDSGLLASDPNTKVLVLFKKLDLL